MKILRIILAEICLFSILMSSCGGIKSSVDNSQEEEQQRKFYQDRFFRTYARAPLAFPYQVVRINRTPHILDVNGHFVIESPTSLYCTNNYIFGLSGTCVETGNKHAAFILHAYNGYVEEYSDLNDFENTVKSLAGGVVPEFVSCNILVQDFYKSSVSHFSPQQYSHTNKYDNSFGRDVFKTNSVFSIRSNLWPNTGCLDFGRLKADESRRVIFTMANESYVDAVSIEKIITSENSALKFNYRISEGNMQTTWNEINVAKKQEEINVKPRSKVQFAIGLKEEKPAGKFVESFGIKNSDIDSMIKFTVFGEIMKR